MATSTVYDTGENVTRVGFNGKLVVIKFINWSRMYFVTFRASDIDDVINHLNKSGIVHRQCILQCEKWPRFEMNARIRFGSWGLTIPVQYGWKRYLKLPTRQDPSSGKLMDWIWGGFSQFNDTKGGGSAGGGTDGDCGGAMGVATPREMPKMIKNMVMGIWNTRKTTGGRR